MAAQVPLLRYLADRVPGLAEIARDAGDAVNGEPPQQTVLDALTDAAEALQVLDVQRRHPDALGDTQPVRGHSALFSFPQPRAVLWHMMS